MVITRRQNFHLFVSPAGKTGELEWIVGCWIDTAFYWIEGITFGNTPGNFNLNPTIVLLQNLKACSGATVFNQQLQQFESVISDTKREKLFLRMAMNLSNAGITRVNRSP